MNLDQNTCQNVINESLIKNLIKKIYTYQQSIIVFKDIICGTIK